MRVRLKNTGNYKGTEAVQLYIRDIIGSRTRPVKELKAFKRISLLSGEEKIVNLKLHTNQQGFYNQKMINTTEPVDFKASIGGDSNADLEIEFSIE